jgi:hypothetical protein
VTTNFYGEVLVEERIVNQIDRGGWMEGDLLDVAMGMEDCTQPMEVVVSASVSPGIKHNFRPGFWIQGGSRAFARISSHTSAGTWW